MKMMLAGVPSLNNDDHRRRGHGRSDLITVKVMAILLLLISTPAHSIGGVDDDDDDVEYVEITCYIDTQPFDYTASSKPTCCCPTTNLARLYMIPLVKLRIMFSEALKLKPVRLAFSRDWNEETHITKQDTGYIGCWPLMSFNLVAWKNSGYVYWKSEKKLENCLVNTPWNASEVGDLLMRPNDEAI
uniref:Uncharacterized protein n=1 Tax=Oryza glumipatula TaxID=40148 RepID=A0A0E0B9V7_9ORYZ